MAQLQLGKICDLVRAGGIPAELEGPDVTIRGVNTLEEASGGELSFLSNPKYRQAMLETGASAVVVPDGVDVPQHLSAIRSADAYAAITLAIVAVHGYRQHPQWGLSQQATIHPTATIGENPNMAGGVTIGANARIGDHCTIYPGCYVADDVVIGEECTLYPNVVVYDHCTLGDRVTVHAGSVIGQDGLGYAPHNGKWVKIPQVGRVIVGDDVEIGANCAIDRATLGHTAIGNGTKFGNVVVIGHGTRVGPDCMFVGLVGLAGSVTVGRHVTLAGQVGSAGHLTIGDNARAGGQSGIAGDIPPDTEVLGAPAMPIQTARRALAAMQKLPEWVRRVRALEREVKTLQSKLEGEGRV